MSTTHSRQGRPVRVLHFLNSLSIGGVETWLMHVLRNIDRDRVQMDFAVEVRTRRGYEDEVLRLGSRIWTLPEARSLLYERSLARLLIREGPYDVVHSQSYHYSGRILRVAHRCGVPVRIAHSHMDYSMQDAASSPLRRLYIRVMDAWIRRYGTVGLACGAAAAKALYGARYGRDPRVSVLHCGLDLGAFDGTGDVHAVRAELAIPDDAPVVGHVGRFDGQKNHAFLIDVAERVCKAMPDVRFLLVGDGPLRAGIEADVARRGLSSNFIFAGNRRDVPRLMLGAMDSFVLPSRYEGLPLVLVEAQAAGLPCIASTAVTSEADLVPGLVQHLDLALPLERWAEEVVKSVSSAPPVSRAAALDIVKQTDFSIDQCVRRLLEVYGV